MTMEADIAGYSLSNFTARPRVYFFAQFVDFRTSTSDHSDGALIRKLWCKKPERIEIENYAQGSKVKGIRIVKNDEYFAVEIELEDDGHVRVQCESVEEKDFDWTVVV